MKVVIETGNHENRTVTGGDILTWNKSVYMVMEVSPTLYEARNLNGSGGLCGKVTLRELEIKLSCGHMTDAKIYKASEYELRLSKKMGY